MSGPVLVHVEDPGAANYVAELPAALESAGSPCVLVAEGMAAALLERRGVSFRPRGAQGAAALLDAWSPAAVVVGTSENPDSEGHALVREARARGVATVGVVDAFANASQRFRGRTEDPLAFAPDVVLVPDPWTRDAYVALGMESSRVELCGHPQYDLVLRERERLAAMDRVELRRAVLPTVGDAPLVVFVSEISTGLDPQQFQRGPEYTLQGRGSRDGRTEIVLEEVIDALRECAPGAVLVSRLHPKNTREEFGALLGELAGVSEGGSPLAAVWAADLVIGMSSMLLLEAALLGRPTLSVVPRELERDWLPSTRTGATPCVTMRGALRDRVRSWAASDWAIGAGAGSITVETGAVERVVRAIVRAARQRES